MIFAFSLNIPSLWFWAWDAWRDRCT